MVLEGAGACRPGCKGGIGANAVVVPRVPPDRLQETGAPLAWRNRRRDAVRRRGRGPAQRTRGPSWWPSGEAGTGAADDPPAVATGRTRLASPDGETAGIEWRDLPFGGGWRRGGMVPRPSARQWVQQRTVHRTPQSVVADLGAALRQPGWQTSAAQCQGRQRPGLPPVMAGVLGAATDLSIIERAQTARGAGPFGAHTGLRSGGPVRSRARPGYRLPPTLAFRPTPGWHERDLPWAPDPGSGLGRAGRAPGPARGHAGGAPLG